MIAVSDMDEAAGRFARFTNPPSAPRLSLGESLCGTERIPPGVPQGREIIKNYKGTPALDAGLLSAAQSVEHYEISRYGTLKTRPGELGLAEALELLEATLAEEKATDEELTELAEAFVNYRAEAA